MNFQLHFTRLIGLLCLEITVYRLTKRRNFRQTYQVATSLEAKLLLCHTCTIYHLVLLSFRFFLRNNHPWVFIFEWFCNMAYDWWFFYLRLLLFLVEQYVRALWLVKHSFWVHKHRCLWERYFKGRTYGFHLLRSAKSVFIFWDVVEFFVEIFQLCAQWGAQGGCASADSFLIALQRSTYCIYSFIDRIIRESFFD